MKTLQRFRTLAKDTLRPGAPDFWDSAAFVMLVLLAGVAPLLYAAGTRADRHAVGGGAVLPVGNMLLELSAFLILTALFLSRAPMCPLRPIRAPLICALALEALGLFQWLPLPENVLARVSPASLKTYQDASAILRTFGGQPSWAPRISIAPMETLGVILLIVAYAVLFVSAASLLYTRSRRRVFLAAVIATSVVHIFAAAVRESPGGRVRGAFVNPDHFAAYLEIALSLAFGVLWARVLMARDTAREVSWSVRFERRAVPVAGRTLLWGIIAAGIGLTRSRGGILSAVVTTAVLWIMAVSRRSRRSRRRAGLAAGLALGAGALFAVAMVGSGPFLRFLELDPFDLSTNDRVTIWKASLEAWRAFPLLGSGLGTFREAFRRFQPRELPVLTEHAHSDSLQLLVTGGAIGAAIGVVACLSLFVLLARAWSGQKHREESALALAGFGSLLSLTLHGFVDFGLSVPAIPATLAGVLGASWAAGRMRSIRER